MKYSIKLMLSLIFTLVFAFAVQAQNSEWVRIESDNGEFSIEMPKTPTYFYDKEGFYYSKQAVSFLQYSDVQLLNASDGKTVMSLEIYKVDSPKEALNLLLDKEDAKTQKLENLPKDFSGKQIEKTVIDDIINRKDVKVSYVSKYIISKTHLYIVTVADRSAKTPAFEKFLASMRLGENQTGNVKISSLKALTLTDIGFDATDQPKPSTSSPKPAKPKDKTQNPTPILILSKPQASYTEAARKSFVTGTLRLRVTFEKDGRVSKIGLISTLQGGLTRSAFFAALRIKFIPPEKEGVPHSLSKRVEYSFMID